jgi:hypothetical protein
MLDQRRISTGAQNLDEISHGLFSNTSVARLLISEVERLSSGMISRDSLHS